MRLLPLLLLPAALVLADAAGWQTKPVAAWAPEDARQLLADSPWVRTVQVNLTRLETEFERREGGNMGQPHGVGVEGVDTSKTKSKLPPMLFRSPTDPVPVAKPVTLRLSWESALPVRAAELKGGFVEPPTLSGEGYTLAVYGIPGSYFKASPEELGAPLMKNAVLRRAGKKDVRPTRAEAFQREDGLVVVYRFPLSAEISVKDGSLMFSAQIGRLGVNATFDAAAMVFQDRLEI